MKKGGILLLAENTVSGGINTYAVLIAEGLRARGIPVEIGAVWPKPENWLQVHCQQKGLALTILAARRSMMEWPAAINRLAHMIREKGFGIVHSQGHYSNLVSRAAYLASGRRARLVATVHGIAKDPRLGLKLFYWLDRHTYRCNHGTIANSRHTARRLEKLGVKTGNLKTISIGIASRADAERLNRLPTLRRGSEQGTSIIAFVGRLSPEKGCLTLIEAARILKERGLRFKLVVVGNGPEASCLQSLVTAYGLAEQVTFEGWQAEVARYYQRADIVAVPSLRESLGLTILEAMLYGCTVVASRVQAIPEIVKDGQTGILVNPGDPKGLAEALERCLTDPQVRARLGEAGRQYVLAHHTVEGMIDQTLAVYQQALGEGAS